MNLLSLFFFSSFLAFSRKNEMKKVTCFEAIDPLESRPLEPGLEILQSELASFGQRQVEAHEGV